MSIETKLPPLLPDDKQHQESVTCLATAAVEDLPLLPDDKQNQESVTDLATAAVEDLPKDVMPRMYAQRCMLAW